MLKKTSLILCGMGLGVLTLIMVFSAIFPKFANGQTETETTAVPQVDVCTDFGTDNMYLNPDLGAEEIMQLYHETINTKFNEYIAKMIAGQKAAAEANQPDLNNKPPDETIGETCSEDNYSTYCIATSLLSNGTYGYMAYVKALNCRRYQLFDTTKERDAWQAYSEAMITGTPFTPESEGEAAFTTAYQGQKALTISARLDAINREIQSSKRALDQTLSAYEELKTAWPMHQRYIQIYNSLVQYRDNLVEIRHQVEEFPSKFIDATTTKCT